MKLLMGSHDGTKMKHKHRRLYESLMGVNPDEEVSDSEEEEDDCDTNFESPAMLSDDVLAFPSD